MQSVEKAVKMYEAIKEACVRPDKSISGETLNIYNELVDWGFLEKYPISNAENKFLYVTIIAMQLEKTNIYDGKDNGKSLEKGKWLMIQEALNRTNKKLKKKE
jgi:hypothetical protein